VVADATPDRLGARHHEDQSGSLDATALNTFSGIQDSIQCAVQSDVPVLISHGAAIDRIQLATTIHSRSRRQHGPFVVHDVRSGEEALDRQLTASANGGTLFVVEIAALEHRMQCTLLRWLDKRVDSDVATPIPRVIAGTGEQLFTRVSENDFDVTLFYRLNVIHLVLPEKDDNRKARQANTVTSSITV
jgi:DNA-binding NtrC family response regulator